jgi:hypothetical protein
MIVAGIMSGTSLDGIDVALVDIRGRRFTVHKFWTVPYPAKVRKAILAAAAPPISPGCISCWASCTPKRCARAECGRIWWPATGRRFTTRASR